MKITDLPGNSQAANDLRKIDAKIRRERLRCAGEAFDVAKFAYEKYKDEPGQWFRCEQILRAILKDDEVTIAWLMAGIGE